MAITVTPDAAVRLENATREHIGKPIAVLVNGTVVSAPRLDGVLRDKAAIVGAFTRADAEQLAAALTGH